MGVERDDGIAQLAKQGAACQRYGVKHAATQHAVDEYDYGDKQRDQGNIGRGVDDPGGQREGNCPCHHNGADLAGCLRVRATSAGSADRCTAGYLPRQSSKQRCRQ